MEPKDQIKVVNSWIKDLSKALALDVELSLNEEGICLFQVGENLLAIEVSSEFPMVYLYSSLMALPVEDKELNTFLLTKALEINAFQALTRGGAIAVVPGGGLLIYCYSIPIEGVNSEKFSQILGVFFETLPELKKMLSESQASDLKMNKDFLSPKFLKI